MTEERTNIDSNDVLGHRRGLPVYRTNPSLTSIPTKVKVRSPKTVNGQRAVVFNDTSGEVAGEGSVAFLEREVVDPEKFVKLYISGLDGIFKLSKGGQRVFRILWLQVQRNQDRDRVELTHYIAEDYGDKMTERVFQRGVRELLEKEFIYHSPTAGLYFFNVQFMFNGNRIVTAKEYVLEDTAQQQSLPFDGDGS